MSKLCVLDLFSGIGGFETVAFCEIEPFPRRVLAKHWPGVPIYDDVRTLTADRLRADGISVDVICGGFPCQDISHAGKGAGIEGERSGLWSEYARIIGELRPAYVIVENVSALLGRGLDRVLGDLAALGFDAEWHCIRAADVGAPHLRDRLWLVAYPQHSDANSTGSYRAQIHVGGSSEFRDEQVGQPRSMGEDVANTQRLGPPRSRKHGQSIHPASRLDWQAAWSVDGGLGSVWGAEPDVGRVADGVPSRMDRLKGLGNAVVPQIPELIGRAILEARASC
jgi:DNA (cytosine-5)-methyltransferase 1